MMNILYKNTIDIKAFEEATSKPEVYQKSTTKFWDDDYISKQMLNFHLNPDVEAASKKEKTIKAETKFIIEKTQLDPTKSVIDLGCGPGLYVKEFANVGSCVVGVDISQNSIDYASKKLLPLYKKLSFLKMNYLELDEDSQYDLATMIYYDFGALNVEEQNLILKKIHRALKQNGTLVIDVLTNNAKQEESMTIKTYEQGFWSYEPYIEIHKKFVYHDPLVRADQYTLVNEQGDIRVIRNYDRLFTRDEIKELLLKNGFSIGGVFNNLEGDPFTDDSKTMGIFAHKQ